MAKPSFIAFEQKPPRGVDIASPQEGKITIFDFKEGREYRASNGSVMKILSVTDSGRFLIFLKDTLEGVTENDSNKRYTEVQLRELVVKHGFVLSAETSVSAKHPVPEPATETTSPKVVVDMGVARGQRGMEPVPVKLEQQNALFSEIEELDYEIAPALESIDSKMKAIWAVLEEVKEDATVETIRTRAVEASQRASDLSAEDDAADDEQKGKAFTREYVDAKRKRLEELQNIFVQLVALSSDIEVQEAAVVEAGAPVEVTMTAGGKSDAVVPGSGEGAPADKKPRASRKDKGSDTKGPEGPEEFGGVLENLRTEVLGLIDAIKTPTEYAALRRGMLMLPPKEEGAPPRYNFFNLEDIKDRVRRVISDEELKQVQALERELREATRIKFLRLEYDDLNKQYNREQAKVDAAKNQTACQAIADRWTKKPNINFIWKDVLDDLTEREQRIVSQDYQRRSEELSANLHKKRESLRIASVEARDARERRGEEAKEPSNEVLFSGLVDALRKRESLSFGKDVDKKELIIDDIKDTEIKFTYDGKPAKTQPQYVKKFLKFLKEKFSWSFGEMSQKEREMREIGLALEKIIQEKKNEAKISFDAMPGDEKKKIQQKYDNWMAFLDDNWRDAERLFEEGQLVVLRKMLKVFQQEEFWESQPDETAPKVEKSGERTYETLAEMLSKIKKKQCGSVVSEGLAPFGQYAEEQNLTLQSVVESMGIKKTAEGMVDSLAGILPAQWSKEERFRFALQFAQREIRESLE